MVTSFSGRRVAIALLGFVIATLIVAYPLIISPRLYVELEPDHEYADIGLTIVIERHAWTGAERGEVRRRDGTALARYEGRMIESGSGSAGSAGDPIDWSFYFKTEDGQLFGWKRHGASDWLPLSEREIREELE